MSAWLRASTPEQIGSLMKEFEATERARTAGERYRAFTPEQHAEQVRGYVRAYNDMIEAWDSGDQARLTAVMDAIKPESERYGMLASYLAADVSGMRARLEKARDTVREGLRLLASEGASADKPAAKKE